MLQFSKLENAIEYFSQKLVLQDRMLGCLPRCMSMCFIAGKNFFISFKTHKIYSFYTLRTA